MSNFFQNLQDAKTAAELQDSAIAKFTKYGRGIHTSSYTKAPYRSETAAANEMSWTDLGNPNLVSIGTLKGLCSKYGNRIAQHVNDPAIFGNTDTVFVHVTQRGQEIEFSAEDCYLICRAAILEQQNTKEYRKAIKEKQELQAEMQKLQTPAQRRKDIQSRMKELNKVLEPEVAE